MTMTMGEVRKHVEAEPERAHVLVFEEADGSFVARWEGETARWSNMFGIDSKLTDLGVPQPRNLYLVSPEDAEEGL